MVFLDESGFLLIPTRRRTWGPAGCTPIIRYSYRHDRISALGALTVSALRKRVGLYLCFQQNNFKAVHVAKFLRHLLRQLRGHVILLWDGGGVHRGPEIKRLRHDYPRLHVASFPKYAPELNPAEQIWNDFKGRTANSLFHNKQALRLRLHGCKRRVCRSQLKLASFVVASDLPSPPW